LQEQYAPTDIVIPDQFLDRTRGRVSTFFGEGIVAHITFDHPVCHVVGEAMAVSGEEVGVTVHRGGTYLCMEGPAFSTLAESRLYRQWGMDVIGMTNLQEAKLAREAEICYSTLALVTDYDCWHPEHSSVTVEMILDYLHRNAVNAQQIIRHSIRRLRQTPRSCKCATALRHAILTQRDLIPTATRRKLAAILDPVLGGDA
jgi:5'-methylthioadenosine phosphorylase